MSIDLAPKVKEGRVVYVLIPLLVLHLTLISLQIEDPAGTTLLKKWMLLGGTPFFDLSSGISRGARGFWSNYIWLHGAREENLQLKESVRLLALRERQLVQAEEENARLHRLLDFRQQTGFQGVAAHVVGRVPGYLANVTYIDRGIDDGIRPDSPVVIETGVIGRVVLATRRHAQVQLITNPDASTGVMIERTRSPGVLKGTGNPFLELNYISNTEQVNAGDTVITSGLDGIFPKGLPVGKVVESHKGKSVFRSIQVEPYIDLLRIEDVLVLPSSPRKEE